MTTDLTPSQVIRSTAGGSRRRRRRNGPRRAPNREEDEATSVEHERAVCEPRKESSKVRETPRSTSQESKKKNGKLPNQAKSSDNQKVESTSVDDPNTKKKKPKKRKNRKKPLEAWKKLLPDDSVDPITLDALSSLKYPPFALVAELPYTPIDWPPSSKVDAKSKAVAESEEERQARILKEQWGAIKKDEGPKKENTLTCEGDGVELSTKERHVNLFDGRALAYYMVSQLQFIDPLNRRDLTRDEIVHLDHYLRRHGFFDLNVTEAYDAKGITISTAGAAAQTANGRATILQQEAQHLLNALFGARQNQPPPIANNFARDYMEHEASQNQPPSRPRNLMTHNIEDAGVYGEGTDYVVIDDDLNPGLRAGNSNHLHQPNPAPQLRSTAPVFVPTRDVLFPPLDANGATKSSSKPEADSKPPPVANLPKAKTLSKIGSLVRKTDPKEQQRQWEAREAAIRKASLVNRSFNSLNPVNSAIPSLPSVVTTATISEPTEGQIRRNMAFASALGVKPTAARARQEGWARPSSGTDEFGNELAVTIYPETLVREARNLRPGLLAKIERKWKTFLADDTSASLPLNPMDRPTRKTIHEYSDFWKLHTESFDPEPKRYIHCVKLVDTCAPKPLLSEVLYTPQQPPVDRPTDQSAGQASGREFPQPPVRTSLQLKPPSKSEDSTATQPTSGFPLGGRPSLSMGDAPVSERFAALSPDHERPKLELAKRTLPLELPEFKPMAEDEKLQRLREKNQLTHIRKEQQVQRAQKVLEAAFASDDEDDANDQSDASSDWEEQAPLFTGSDEEK